MIETLFLFRELDQELFNLLRSLKPQDWSTKTSSPAWTVKDIAAHLLDGNMRTLSMLRDNFYGVRPDDVSSYEGLLRFLNKLNNDWTNAFRRISPAVLVDLLESTGKEYIAFLETLDPMGTASFAVAWAGETESKNWFHIAREYTEKWHHQQQIREAVKAPDILLSKRYYFPYLDTSVRAIPFQLRDTHVSDGEGMKVTVTGDGGGTWNLRYRSSGGWAFTESQHPTPRATVTIPGSIAWKIFCRQIQPGQAEEKSEITGDGELARKIFSVIAVMA